LIPFRIPTSYLDLPLNARFTMKFIWEPIIDRIEKKTFGVEV